MEGVSEVQTAVLAGVGDGLDVADAVAVAMRGPAGWAFLEGNKHFLKDSRTKCLDVDLLSNLELIDHESESTAGRPVHVSALDNDGPRHRQSRLWELKYWGFVEQVEPGVYALTQAGHDFLHNGASAPSSLRIWNDQVIEENPVRGACNENYMAMLGRLTK